jgi:hypothetical protein
MLLLWSENAVLNSLLRRRRNSMLVLLDNLSDAWSPMLPA